MWGPPYIIISIVINHHCMRADNSKTRWCHRAMLISLPTRWQNQAFRPSVRPSRQWHLCDTLLYNRPRPRLS